MENSLFPFFMKFRLLTDAILTASKTLIMNIFKFLKDITIAPLREAHSFYLLFKSNLPENASIS